MKRATASAFILIVTFLGANFALAQGAYKIQPVPALPSDVPKDLQEVLRPQGARLLNDQGAAVCEVWWRNEIPIKASSGSSSGVLYGGLEVGTFVGVLRFVSAGSDFRGQPIKPGYYTLRYALVPQDGNHMGVSNYRDFLLLSPAAEDSNPDQVPKFDELVKLSRKASGTGHPAVFNMGPADTSSQSLPALVKDDQGHWLLEFEIHGKQPGGPKDLRLAFILVGQAEAA